MAKVHCPKCNRALSLPDDLQGTLVRCPICGASFQALPAPILAQPAALPPAASREHFPTRAMSFDLEEEEYEAPSPDRRLRSAAKYLQWMIVIQGVCIGISCCSALWLPALVTGTRLISCMYVASLFLIYAGTYQLEARMNYKVAVFGSVMALLNAVFSLICGVGNIQTDSAAVLFLILPSGSCGLVGSIKALSALSDAKVRARFLSVRQNQKSR
jgi:hypothetical protein